VPLIAAALQFPLRHPAVTSVLTGPRTAAELRSNAEDFDRDIPTHIWSDLEDAGLVEKVQA
jgi:D-threo-aldose 1-dehydrogenase